MGGRGSYSGSAGGNGGNKDSSKSSGADKEKKSNGGGGNSGKESAADAVLNSNTKYSTKELNNMTRGQLETVAAAVYVKRGVAMGLSPQEAYRRFTLIADGNTTAYLRKYVKKYG